jgi:HupE / UreJ protein
MTRAFAANPPHWIFWLVLLPALTTAPAFAHKASDAYLRVDTTDQQVALRIDVALRDLDRDLVLDADDDGLLRWREVRTRMPDVDAFVDQGISVSTRDRDGKRCRALAPPTPDIARLSDGAYLVLRRLWRCNATPVALDVKYSLFGNTDPTHRGILIVADRNGADRSGADPVDRATTSLPPRVLPPDGAPQTVSLQSAASPIAERLLTIFFDGAHHIRIGFDHLLFLAALLLPAVMRRDWNGWRPGTAFRAALLETLGVVTAFTAAHSITLALATLGILQPSPRLVESAIAASVAIAALNNLWPLFWNRRWRIAFAFGLVHGFGFASALADLGIAANDRLLPLLAFNLGVEAGQVAIVTIFVPLAWSLRRWPGYARWCLSGGSWVILALAIFWFVERLLAPA